MTVDCAYYVRGVRQQAGRMSLADAAALPRRGGSYVWIELEEPSKALMAEVCGLFDLHPLAVEDAAHAHQRPKVEPYDGFHLVVFKTAHYDAGTHEVEFGELDIFIGAGFVIAVRHGAAGEPQRARELLELHPGLLKTGPAAVVWGLLDLVVDDYAPVLEALDGEIEELEHAIFARHENLTERIYQLKQQTNELYRAAHPLLEPLEAIERGAFPEMDPGLARYFRDIADHVRRLQEEVLGLRDQLANALEANLALISVRQNEIAAQQNKIARQLTIVATVFLPLTFVTGFFGQNFGWMVRHIDSGTAFLLLGIGGLIVPCIALYLWFHRSGYVGDPSTGPARGQERGSTRIRWKMGARRSTTSDESIDASGSTTTT